MPRPPSSRAALSDAELARLERERGLFVAHTYLGPSARTTQSADQLARLVVVEAKGSLAIHPALDAALARLAARVRAGRLASLAWAEAGDRLRALADVEVTYRPDGAAEVHNHGAEAVEALTVALPAAGLDVALEGAALARARGRRRPRAALVRPRARARRRRSVRGTGSMRCRSCRRR